MIKAEEAKIIEERMASNLDAIWAPPPLLHNHYCITDDARALMIKAEEAKITEAQQLTIEQILREQRLGDDADCLV